MSTINFRETTFVLLAIGFVVAADVTALGQNPKPSPSPVTAIVVNTASQPVPVSGTVNVGNLGSSPLPVSGVVGVQNAVGSSLQTRNLDAPTRQRVHHFFFGNPSSYTVPDGKLLVIDYISGMVVSAQTDPMPMMEIYSTPAPGVDYFITPNSWIDDHFGSRHWVWATQTQMFFPAGSVWALQYAGVSGSGTVENFSFNGYLVDVP